MRIKLYFLIIVVLLVSSVSLVSCSSNDSLSDCDFNLDGEVVSVEKKICLQDRSTWPDKKEISDIEIKDSIESVDLNDTDNLVDLGLPIYLTTMTHMESNHKDDVDEGIFIKHISYLTYAMDLADEYGAKLTIESEKPFAMANVIWDNNFMLEVLQRGHGVGTHCDVGFRNSNSNYQVYSDQLKENKQLIDNLIGEENNWGCSGAGSEQDWVSGLLDAGFIYVNGVVSMHLLTMPVENRPEGYTNDVIYNGGYFHHHLPFEILDRINLRYLADSNDFEADSSGLIMSAGSMGKLSAIAEGGYHPETHLSKESLTNEDVNVFVELISEIDMGRDRSKVNKVDLYFADNDWSDQNEDVLIYFFSEMEKLQDSGIIKWATQKEVVETFLKFN